MLKQLKQYTSKIPNVNKKISKNFKNFRITNAGLFKIVTKIKIPKIYIINKIVSPNYRENSKTNKLEKVGIIKSNIGIIL